MLSSKQNETSLAFHVNYCLMLATGDKQCGIASIKQALMVHFQLDSWCRKQKALLNQNRDICHHRPNISPCLPINSVCHTLAGWPTHNNCQSEKGKGNYNHVNRTFLCATCNGNSWSRQLMLFCTKRDSHWCLPSERKASRLSSSVFAVCFSRKGYIYLTVFFYLIFWFCLINKKRVTVADVSELLCQVLGQQLTSCRMFMVYTFNSSLSSNFQKSDWATHACIIIGGDGSGDNVLL